ncbi:phage tail tube protein [Sinorhizobium fredii]|uniref:phage tail tube protein n=1 Tax=Rhizobium fredii TaxID=380 RepID=UPI0004B681B0|nr:phage tail tube protein [Sinorhizobium fredii]ASY68900.1 Phage protein [Sinorhizobium fredii CCBAU 83666]
MAAPTTARFGKFRVLIGDGASPEQFVAPCGFTSKSLALSKNLTDVNLPDCDDPDAPAWVGRDVESLTASITGEGVMAAESVETWMEAFESTDSVNVKVEIELPAVTYTYTGRMHIASMTLGAEQGGRVTNNVEMQSDGELVRTLVTA